MSKSSVLSSLKQTGVIYGSDMVTSGKMIVATLQNLYIFDMIKGELLKEHASKQPSKAHFKPNFNTVYALEENSSLFWWRDSKTLLEVSLATLEVAHAMEIVPFFKGSRA